MKKLALGILVLLVIASMWFFAKNFGLKLTNSTSNLFNQVGKSIKMLHPLSIESLKLQDYPGSDLVIEETLEPGSNYQRYVVSYTSEGLKIYALLTLPNGQKPSSGWPVIIFNHGYIAPDEYKTTEKYIAYTDGFSKSGYIVFRPDYRGHGNSEGEAPGGYGSNAYTIDVLNGVSSIKKYPAADPTRIGMWGHSMGGHITLRSMVVSSDIKAGVIWAGVVASYPDLLTNWARRSPPPQFASPSGQRRWRMALVQEFGAPEANPSFWDSISATSYLADLSGPLQLHHGTRDTSVPVEFSQKLYSQLEPLDERTQLYVYQNDDHNLSKNFSLAMSRSVEFFDKYVKGR